MGSWKIMAISLPRSLRRPAGLRVVSSCCSNRIEPVTRETLAGKRPMTASAETVLPEPLSPTRPSVVPRASENVGVLHDRKPLLPGEEFDPQSLDPEECRLALGLGRELGRAVPLSS